MSAPIPATANLLEIIVPFDPAGKRDVAVYRYHGDAVETLTGTANADGESAVLGPDRITLRVRKFSTYAVGYAVDTYTVTFDSRGGSAVASQSVPHGGTAAEPAAPVRSGYTFGGWYTDAACTAPWDFGGAVTAGMTLYAKWTQSGGGSTGGGGGGGGGTARCTVTAAAGTGGAISPSGRVSVSRNGEKTFTITPESGYEIADVLVDGRSVGAVRTYTFEKVTESHTIEARFREAGHRAAWNPFADVNEGDWFYDSVRYVYENGLMNGTSGTAFSPYLTTNRGMIVTVLWRLEGAPESGGAMPFADVPAGSYCHEAVAWAAEHGVVRGYTETEFRPEAPITREQLAAILYRYGTYRGHDMGADGDLSRFADQPSGWAREAVAWAVGAGVLTGRSGGRLDPLGSAARAEAAVMLTRYRAAEKTA